MIQRLVSILAASALCFACSDGSVTPGADASNDVNAADAQPDVTTSNDSGPSEDSSPVDDGSSDATTTCTSLDSPPGDAGCASCVLASCCSDWNECQGNADCVGYVACALACAAAGDAGADAGDGGVSNKDSCYTVCQSNYPNGVNDGIVVVDCETNTCGASCP